MPVVSPSNDSCPVYLLVTGLGAPTQYDMTFKSLGPFSGVMSASSYSWKDLIGGNMTVCLHITNKQYYFFYNFISCNSSVSSLFSSFNTLGGLSRAVATALIQAISRNSTDGSLISNVQFSSIYDLCINIPSFSYTPTHIDFLQCKIAGCDALIYPPINAPFDSNIIFRKEDALSNGKENTVCNEQKAATIINFFINKWIISLNGPRKAF